MTASEQPSGLAAKYITSDDTSSALATIAGQISSNSDRTRAAEFLLFATSQRSFFVIRGLT